MKKIFEMNFDEEFLKLAKEKERKEIREAREEIKKIFSKHVLLSDKISIGLLQRKLRLGYMKVAKFIDILAMKKIISNSFGVRDILNKELLVKEAVEYFTPIIRDRNKFAELNKNDVFAFVLHDEFDVGRVDYYWLNRLVYEHFAKDKKFVETLDDIFGTNLSKRKNLNKMAMSILSERKIDTGLLAIFVLQYFSEKLKYKTLDNCDYIDIDLREKLRKLRFFDKGEGEINERI